MITLILIVSLLLVAKYLIWKSCLSKKPPTGTKKKSMVKYGFWMLCALSVIVVGAIFGVTIEDIVSPENDPYGDKLENKIKGES